MTLWSHEKFEEKLTCGLQNDMRNLAFFIRTLDSVKIGVFIESFCPKKKIHELQTYRGVISNDPEE